MGGLVNMTIIVGIVINYNTLCHTAFLSFKNTEQQYVSLEREYDYFCLIDCSAVCEALNKNHCA